MSLKLTLSNELKCPHCNGVVHDVEVYTCEITHNLGNMAQRIGVYKHFWRQEELGIDRAYQLKLPLRWAIDELTVRRNYYKQFEPSNKWGTVEEFIKWMVDLLGYCSENPEAKVSTMI